MTHEIALDSLDGSIFEPLCNNTNEIRLLHLEPADSRFELIQFSLHNVQFNQSTQYVVLGSEEGQRQLFDHMALCNNQELLVTAGFHSRLQDLRRLGWQRIWSEELCIDLGSSNENAQQQKLIPAIYRQAIQAFLMPFRHRPLPSRKHIRLLELEPAESRDAPLFVHIHTVSLDREPEFEFAALSYDMPVGSEPARHPLISNKHSLEVTWSVIQALRSMREMGHTSFWFKPICVDHQDPEDLSYHDSMAGRIAQQAVQKLAIDRPGYQYASLKTHRNEVRLLEISLGKSPTKAVVANIITVSLDENPDYVALSYTWGPAEKNYIVFSSDGRMFRVTRNLFLALHEVREQFAAQYEVWQRADKAFCIWADQICVDQLNTDERNTQVLMMGRIYRQASATMIHLGGGICSNEKPHSCHSHWRILMRILALTKRTLRAVRPDNAQVAELEFSRFGIPPFQHRSWHLLRLLRAHPWFSRGWIIQEASACPNVWVNFDGQHFRFADLLDATTAIWYENVPVHEGKAISGRRLLLDLASRDSVGHIGPRPLLALLITFRYVQTTDPRDKIYAFRGMAIDGTTSPLPDYGQSVAEVYHEYAKHFVIKGHGLELIREAGLSKTDLEIPSWVVDWSYNSHSLACNYSRGSRYPPHVSLPDKPDTEIMLTDDPSIISLIGAVFDSVVGITPGIRPLGITSTSDIVDDFVEFDEAAQELLIQVQTLPKIYNAGLLNAYASTLIAGDERFVDPVAAYEEAKAYVRQPGKGKCGDTSNIDVSLGLDQYFNCRTPCLEMRRFCTTQKGYVGLVSIRAEEGDKICFFVGCETPFVVRRRGNVHVLIGDAYVHELMQGQAMAMEDLELQTMFLR